MLKKTVLLWLICVMFYETACSTNVNLPNKDTASSSEGIISARILSKPISSRNKSAAGDNMGFSHFTYLQFDGLKDISLQLFLNKKIEDSLLELENLYEGSSIDGSSSVRFFNGHLMVFSSEGLIKKRNEENRTRLYAAYSLDLHSGRIFELRDLFKPDTEFEKSLFSIIESKSEKYRIKDPGRFVTGFGFKDFLNAWNGVIGRTYTMTEKNLELQVPSTTSRLYLLGYQIPYDDIMSLINTDGDLWKLFTRGEPRNMLVEDRDY